MKPESDKMKSMKTTTSRISIVTDPCAKCGCQIAPARREALPHTSTCVKCSDAKAYVGFMDWGHKTAPEIVMVNPDDRENLRRAQAINERRR
jgi:hypothetical protein